jgi:hypothetical protein
MLEDTVEVKPVAIPTTHLNALNYGLFLSKVAIDANVSIGRLSGVVLNKQELKHISSLHPPTGCIPFHLNQTLVIDFKRLGIGFMSAFV